MALGSYYKLTGLHSHRHPFYGYGAYTDKLVDSQSYTFGPSGLRQPTVGHPLGCSSCHGMGDSVGADVTAAIPIGGALLGGYVGHKYGGMFVTLAGAVGGYMLARTVFKI